MAVGPSVLRNVCVYALCENMCACVCERERGRQTNRGRKTERSDTSTESRYQARQVDHECLRGHIYGHTVEWEAGNVCAWPQSKSASHPTCEIVSPLDFQRSWGCG